VDLIRSLAPDSRIFIQTLYNPFDGYKISALDELAQDKIGRLNEIIRADSEDGENYIVADVAAAFEGKAQELTNISDLDIHPNADGHAQIAKVLEPLIEEQEYTYFDENAQQAYLEEQNDREKSKKQRAAVFVAGAAAVAVTAAAAVLGRKKRSAKQSDERNEL
jgi:hypothetical protein